MANSRLDDIIAFRRKKLENLQQAGIDPYPSSTGRTLENAAALENFDELANPEHPTHVVLVGRIKSLRTMGKLAFAHIDDGTARIQVLLTSNDIGEEKFKQFEDNFDIGDFAEVGGNLFLTKTQEKTLKASTVTMLAKSLRPLPGEYYSLADEEIRLRKRYLEILTEQDTRDLFVKKAKFWDANAKFLKDHGFLEMHMPVLEPIPGGAEAEPFVTHHNALDRDFYLRISLELPLKKMLVAGYPKVFEIGRIFRNEGIDREHLQDYTQLEFYWAYADLDQLMVFVREMYQYVIQETFGTLQLPFRGNTVDWSGEWPTLDYFTLFQEHTGIDLNTASEDDLRTYAAAHRISHEDSAGKGRLIDLIFKKKIRALPEISMQPHFLVNQPIELEPLAKKNPSNPRTVQRMQILACGSEMGKGFGELNDPVDQLARFEVQALLRENGDKEAQMMDTDFLEAMEYGMPPAAGFGMSERNFSIFCDRPLRETVVFPPMKQENQ